MQSTQVKKQTTKATTTAAPAVGSRGVTRSIISISSAKDQKSVERQNGNMKQDGKRVGGQSAARVSRNEVQSQFLEGKNELENDYHDIEAEFEEEQDNNINYNEAVHEYDEEERYRRT